MPKKASDLAAEDDIREAFRVFDRDGNGHISRDEMKAVMMNIGKLGFESEIRVGHKKSVNLQYNTLGRWVHGPSV